MTTKQSILNTLKEKTITHGWDVVVAYNRNKVNALLEQQYVQKVKENKTFPAINWISQNNTFIFDNLVLGMPLLSFSNSDLESSKATATIKFISGTVVRLNDSGHVISLERIDPALGVEMVIQVDLTAGAGTVDKGKIIIDFKKGSLQNIGVVTSPPPEVTQFFNDWLQNNGVTYELGELALGASQGLVPTEFRIRTQPAPGGNVRGGDNYGDGAVVLFVATNYNPNPGQLPTNQSFPWIIPDELSGAIIVSSQTLYGKILKPHFDNEMALTNGGMILKNHSNSGGYPGSSYLYADNTAMRGGIFSWRDAGSLTIYELFSGTNDNNNQIKSDTNVYIDGFAIKPSEDFTGLLGAWIAPSRFYQSFGFYYYHYFDGQGITNYGSKDLEFSMSGSMKSLISVDTINDTISFNGSSTASVTHTYDGSGWISERAKLDGAQFLTSNANKKLSSADSFSFPSLNLFAVNHLLFPQQNIFKFKEVYIPGDLIVFGEISASSTTFRIMPLEKTLAIGQKTTLVVSPARTVTWSISPDSPGSINSATGEYTAPVQYRAGKTTAVVTATDSEGNSSSAIINLASSSVLLSPSFIVINESNARPVQLTASLINTPSSALDWRLYSDEESKGSINSGGLYTPPTGKFKLGCSFVTAAVTSADGNTSYTHICLVSSETIQEFSVMPAYNSNVQPGENINFSANNSATNRPTIWTAFPYRPDSLDEPVKYNWGSSINFTAAENIQTPELSVIQTIAYGYNNITGEFEELPGNMGYAVVDIRPKG